MSKLLEIAMTILFFVAIVFLALVYFGWAFTTLWNWFIPDIFAELPSLTILQGISISLVVGALRPRLVQKDQEPKDAIGFLLSPLIAVGLGFILKFWVGV